MFGRFSPHSLPVLFGLALVTVIVVALGGVFLHSSAGDFTVVHFYNGAHTGWVAAITNTVYQVLKPAGAITLTVLIAGVLGFVHHSLPRAFEFAATVAVAWLPVTAFKSLFDRPRPDPLALSHPFVPHPLDGSYISGHTAFVTVLMCTLYVSLRRTRGQVWVRWLGWLPVVGICAVVLINGVHYPSDVAASLVWACGITPFVASVAVRVCDRGGATRDRLETGRVSHGAGDLGAPHGDR